MSYLELQSSQLRGERERAGCFTVSVVLWSSVVSDLCLFLPCGVMGWSAVCDCGNPYNTHLLLETHCIQTIGSSVTRTYALIAQTEHYPFKFLAMQ